MQKRTLALAAMLASTTSPTIAQTIIWGDPRADQRPLNVPPGQTVIIQERPGQIFVDPNGAQAQQPQVLFDSPPQGQGTVIFEPQPPLSAPSQGIAQDGTTNLIWRASPQPPFQPLPPQPAPQIQQPLIQTAPPPVLPSRPATVLPASPPAPAVTNSAAASTAVSQRPDAVREFASELSGLVQLAERYRAASPGFLEDLKELAVKYETLPLEQIAAVPAPAPTPALSAAPQLPPPPPQAAPQPQVTPDAQVELAPAPQLPRATLAPEGPSEQQIATAPSVQGPPPAPPPPAEPAGPSADLPPTTAAVLYLRDDFADGEFAASPPWVVRQGEWRVDERFGLRPSFSSEPTASPATPGDLLKFLLGDDDATEPSEPSSAVALIESETAIGNAFSLAANITDHQGQGATHFIMHQGAPNWLGYRLELRGGARPVVVLTRRGASGYKDIAKVEAPAFRSGETHQLRWVRLPDGQMFVVLNGRPVITARDTVFRQGWSGFGFFVANGDMSLRSIRIAEPVQQ